MLDAIRRRRSFYAFPAGVARRLWLLRSLPANVSDWLIRRIVKREPGYTNQ